MHVVSNTSPLSNLAISGRLDLLKHRYGMVRIPPAVAQELAGLSHPDGKARLAAAQTAGWLELDSTATGPVLLPFPLDTAETAAIALALALKADLLLIDEKRGRAAAKHVGLPVAGLLHQSNPFELATFTLTDHCRVGTTRVCRNKTVRIK